MARRMTETKILLSGGQGQDSEYLVVRPRLYLGAPMLQFQRVTDYAEKYHPEVGAYIPLPKVEPFCVLDTEDMARLARKGKVAEWHLAFVLASGGYIPEEEREHIALLLAHSLLGEGLFEHVPELRALRQEVTP